MSTINAVSSDSAALAGKSQQAATDQALAANKSAKTDSEKTEKAASSTAKEGNVIELSSRAQKIQKLNEEFFPSGPQSVKITTEFIQRLQEYGFLTVGEAEKLSPAKHSNDDQAVQPLAKLSGFINDFTAKLKDKDPQSSLIDILQKAQSIIKNLDGSNPPDVAIDTKSVIAKLAAYITSEEFQSLNDDEKKSLQQLNVALQVADKLDQKDNRSEQINKYLSVLKQSN